MSSDESLENIKKRKRINRPSKVGKKKKVLDSFFDLTQLPSNSSRQGNLDEEEEEEEEEEELNQNYYSNQIKTVLLSDSESEQEDSPKRIATRSSVKAEQATIKTEKSARSITPPPVFIDLDQDSTDNVKIDEYANLEKIESENIKYHVQADLSEEIVINVHHVLMAGEKFIKPIKIKVFKYKPLHELITVIAEKRAISKDDIVLSFNNVELIPALVPGHFKMENGCTLYSHHRKEFENMKNRRSFDSRIEELKGENLIKEDKDDEKEEAEGISIKVKFDHSLNPLIIIVTETDTIEIISHKIATKFNNGKIPILSFDGDRLLTGTLADNDIEEGDMIEAKTTK